MKRKGLSIFLAVCLVFSMMTFAASAADDGGKVKRESISVEDTGASFRVVKGGRLEISSESAAEDGSYSWVSRRYVNTVRSRLAELASAGSIERNGREKS